MVKDNDNGMNSENPIAKISYMTVGSRRCTIASKDMNLSASSKPIAKRLPQNYSVFLLMLSWDNQISVILTKVQSGLHYSFVLCRKWL